ncbi:hypothetical protein [Rubrobacter indicoceani]|uniref:hypothetical protein n=1 Tax=Rubrobacter indicoceani TaxID=2051957 RepID=UPI000E5ADB45|nr:hypothetical protein [Rubrobacter indicoceani]
MEQRDERLDGMDRPDGEEEVGGSPPGINARLAVWITSVSPLAARRYLGFGLALPEYPARTPGVGEGWQGRAVRDVLTECYARRMLDPVRERVESVAMDVLPPPTAAILEEEGKETEERLHRPRGFETALDRWQRAVSVVSERVAVFLRNGPSADFGGGEVLASGEELSEAERGLLLRQRVDLLGRRADGRLVAVIVVGCSGRGRPPRPPAEDWRVILCSRIVRAKFGRIPEVHLVFADAGVAQVVRPSHRHLTNSLLRLVRAAKEADRGSEKNLEEGFTYPVSCEAVDPLRRGDWPGNRRPGPPGRPRTDF